MRSFIVILLILLSASQLYLWADVNSRTGRIEFDHDSDASFKMILDATGLGVGVSSPAANLHISGNSVITDSLKIGSSETMSSNLDISGSIGFSVETVSSNTTLSGNSVVMVDTSSANVLITLPLASSCPGRQYYVKKTSTLNNLWLSGGGNTIGDESTYEAASGNLGALTVISDGLQWHLLEKYSDVGTVAAANLIGWWKLNETDGTTAIDSSSLGRNGTLASGFSFSTNTVSGKKGNALDFGDSTSGIVNVNQNVTEEIEAANAFTISAWVYCHDLSSDMQIIGSFGGAGSQSWLFWMDTGGGGQGYTLALHTSSGYIRVAEDNATAILNQWQHVLTTFDGTNGTMYVDGVKVIDVSGNDSGTWAPDATTSSTIGSDAGRPFDGYIDDVRVYNRVLSMYEIQALAQ